MKIAISFGFRGSVNLHGVRRGPFHYSERLGMYVLNGKTLTNDEWAQQGVELIQKYHLFKPTLVIEMEAEETDTKITEPTEQNSVKNEPTDTPRAVKEFISCKAIRPKQTA